MEVNVYNMKGKKVSTVELPASVFEAPKYVDLMHQAFLRQMANARLGTHSTKTRSEVSGGGRKPWKQKGTGRARQGSIRSAQWVGGGKIHTPKPRDYSQAMPKKMRRKALRSALTIKASDEQIIVIDDLKLDEPKTQNMAKSLDTLMKGAPESILVLIPDQVEGKEEQYTQIVKATKNLTVAKTLNTRYLNIRDLLKYDRLLISMDSIDIIQSWLGEEAGGK